ncbi:unnamed protein product [Acanthoscelides obtectus]|uniref:Malate dehydrogenase, mitochondrial n=2 Tax=Acanthoscelides obtectus TaxID=200917 RepID=A0A9P0LXF1_ACAOB|nr:unnamed protein product [Acanthoscelides obtectus]CAK1622016.1 Malate dehydrogenase, mitochondrial [Acanthoscelides obtectus]
MWIKMIFNITPVFQKHLNEYVSNFFENGLLDKIIGCKRNYSLSSGNVKVTVVGAAGKMGKPLCLMLKQSLMIDELSMHDVKTTGDALELNNIDTSCKVTAYSGKSNLPPALKGSNVVVVIAAGPDSDSLTPDKQWEQNSKIVSEIMSVHAKYSPKAFLAVGTEPINSVLPLCCETLKKFGSYNPSTVFGITADDSVRANTIIAKTMKVGPECVSVPVIGGHSEETRVPVLSQVKPKIEFSHEEIEKITASIKKPQQKKETSGFLAAFATARFILSLVKGIRGHKNVIECAYVPSKVHPELKYLSTPVQLGIHGVSKNLGLQELTDYEQCMFDNVVTCLAADITKGEKYIGTHAECSRHAKQQ